MSYACHVSQAVTAGLVAVQAHVHQMAVAAGDIYVRVYDRRMLSTGG